jgi:hypothetical protein
MRPSAEEQETHISWGRLDDKARIYTSDSTEMTRLDKLVKNNPDEWKFIEQTTHEGDVVGKFYECPKRLVSLRLRTAVARELTEEQKEAFVKRMSKSREQ